MRSVSLGKKASIRSSDDSQGTSLKASWAVEGGLRHDAGGRKKKTERARFSSIPDSEDTLRAPPSTEGGKEFADLEQRRPRSGIVWKGIFG